MLTDVELERLFFERRTPEAGRQLVRQIRANGPVRDLQGRMDTVRTRYISKKMGLALYAESRTNELAAFVAKENDKSVFEMWPQPCKADMLVDGANGGSTRVLHTPDLFLIEESAFVMEEWREEVRLCRLMTTRPHHFLKDEAGIWHYLPAEKHFARLGIEHRLRSADEHPRVLLANTSFLGDYCAETTPPVPPEEATRLVKLLEERLRIPHLQLVYEHRFKADHIFQMVLDDRVYVDLHEIRLDRVDDLIIYRDKLVSRADAVLNAKQIGVLPTCAMALRVGATFFYDQKPFEVVLLGASQVVAKDADGATTSLPLALVEELFHAQFAAGGANLHPKEYDLDVVIADAKALEAALNRKDALATGVAPNVSTRTLQRWKKRMAGITSPQDQLEALKPGRGGNRSPRLPGEVLAAAEQARASHNTPKRPSIFSTYAVFVALCDDVGVRPMSLSSFYEWIKPREDVLLREGRRKAYQKAPISLTFDYEQPVHGVLPHEVVYVDHTILNVMLKGHVLPDLAKPVLTIATDGALSKTRAFYLSYRPASVASVLMLLRDYVRRNGRLMKVLVLDNGKEFHSIALKLFASLFGIDIRWRRRSKPRDSTLVERALGATEAELISSLDGNSLALKDPRMVSSSHLPEKHIKWTLPALHGSLNHYFFHVHAKRVHPRFGMTPDDYEHRLVMELGAREHVFVRMDPQFKLLTSPHSSQPTRKVDRRKGVFVDGQFYWNDKLALAKVNEEAEVRVEMWYARAAYVCFRGQWILTQARDGGRLEGRVRYELEIQKREESRGKRNEAQKDKKTVTVSRNKVAMWNPVHWDPRLREQCMEEYALYEKLGMTEALPEATNPRAHLLEPSIPMCSQLERILAIQAEPDARNEVSVSASHQQRGRQSLQPYDPSVEAAKATPAQVSPGLPEASVFADEDYF